MEWTLRRLKYSFVFKRNTQEKVPRRKKPSLLDLLLSERGMPVDELSSLW